MDLNESLYYGLIENIWKDWYREVRKDSLDAGCCPQHDVLRSFWDRRRVCPVGQIVQYIEELDVDYLDYIGISLLMVD